MKRTPAYAIAILAAVILSFVPAILWMDFVAPFDAYEVWQRRENELVFRLSKNAAATGRLETEIAIFKLLVAPTILPTLLGIPRPEYTRFAFPDETTVELAGVQPSRLALRFSAVAVPTWTILLVVAYELLRRLRRARTAV